MENVTPDTIRICFRKAGILNKEFQVVTRIAGDIEEDRFADLDDNCDTQDLRTMITQIKTGDDSCSVKEFINADSKVPVCDDVFDDKLEREFLDQVAKQSASKAERSSVQVQAKSRNRKRRHD